MVFVNERTYLNSVESGRIEEFHKRYENAVDKVKETFGEERWIWIDGEEVRSRSGTFDDRSPNDKRILLGKFQKGSALDARKAVESARDAFPDWSRTDYKERIKIFIKATDLMSEEKYNLAALMTYENGKNRFEAIADVDEAIDLIRWYCNELIAYGGFEKEMGRYVVNERSKSLLLPYGVWAVISPFNFPLAITGGMTAGAVLTGNTVVLKPSSETPFTALRLYELLTDAGLPPGVLNFLTGPGSTAGQELVKNPEVRGFIFTGSREVGMNAYKNFTSTYPKPIITEMGGKNPCVVTAHADLDKAVEGVAKAAFGYGGQKCSACSRVIVHKRVKEEFVRKLVSYTKGLKVGDPTHKDVFLGPMINKEAYDKFQKTANTARKAGKVLIGGKIRREGMMKYGYYVEATIVDRLPKRHRLLKEELFLPILAIIQYESLEEAMKIVNGVDYGLTGGIFSDDVKEIEAFFETAEIGTVYANRTMGATTGAIVGAQPFVGWKMSGISGKGAGGHYYLQQFLRERSQTTYV